MATLQVKPSYDGKNKDFLLNTPCWRLGRQEAKKIGERDITSSEKKQEAEQEPCLFKSLNSLFGLLLEQNIACSNRGICCSRTGLRI